MLDLHNLSDSGPIKGLPYGHLSTSKELIPPLVLMIPLRFYMLGVASFEGD
ncbi:hypothetical protein DES53_11853 [Roseimicrobium gellanilyticum]|uniref:Uncharacterized protein n=1 Tax=Roseimicrobium gellanilyticum TaxID=748857 RepID=A0A366H480_9BACT|nr:hypothetical protein DES53_11853 [Roseimicrobium gellanilyticum]